MLSDKGRITRHKNAEKSVLLAMDRGILPAPGFPLPNPFVVKIHVLQREHMRMFLVYHFGEAFMSRVMSAEAPVVLPVLIYGEVWDLTVYVLT